MTNFHENLGSRIQADGSSNRAFGLVFTAFFLIIAFLPLWHGAFVRYWALLVSGLLLVISFVAPNILSPLNLFWTEFGLLLGRILSPLSLGVLFYGIVSVSGVLMRLFGKDPLRLKFDRKASTYWIERKPPGPAPQSLDKQF